MSDAERDIPNPNPAGQSVSPDQSVAIDTASLDSGYELADVKLRPILWFGGILLIALVVVHLVLYWVVVGWTDRVLPIEVQVPPADVTPPAVPGPGLDAAPEVVLDDLFRREAERLNTYGWIERDAGTVRIPIEEAMNLLLEEGLPAQDGDTPNWGLGPAHRLDSSGGLWLGAEEASHEESGGAESTEGGESETPDE